MADEMTYTGPEPTSAWMANREQIVSAEFYARARNGDAAYAAIAAGRSLSARANLSKAIAEAADKRKPKAKRNG
jgi:hypothetical protein